MGSRRRRLLARHPVGHSPSAFRVLLLNLPLPPLPAPLPLAMRTPCRNPCKQKRQDLGWMSVDTSPANCKEGWVAPTNVQG